jgi:hypothetical protein
MVPGDTTRFSGRNFSMPLIHSSRICIFVQSERAFQAQTDIFHKKCQMTEDLPCELPGQNGHFRRNILVTESLTRISHRKERGDRRERNKGTK